MERKWDLTAESSVRRRASSTASSPRPPQRQAESKRRETGGASVEGGSGMRSTSQRRRPWERSLWAHSRAGSAILGEADSRARARGRRRDSASSEENEGSGESGKGAGGSARASRRSRADLQAATRAECLRQATFLMILSREGPRMRPGREVPPSAWEEDMGEGWKLGLGFEMGS